MAVCINFLIPRQTLFQKIRNIDDNILSKRNTTNSNSSVWESKLSL